MVDVLVVGAGPAGSALSVRLAARGCETWCLDAAEFPREKACGDCVNPGAVAALSRLGALDRVVEMAPPRRLRGWRIRSAGGRGFEAEYGRGLVGFGIRRRDLDAALVCFAQSRGVRLLARTRVVDILRQGSRVVGVIAVRDGRRVELRARLVVGADGLRSVVATRLGLVARPARRRKVTFVAHLPGAAGLLDGMGELWLAGGGRAGGVRCVGLAPLGDGSLNVTCVQAEDRAGGFTRRPGWRSILTAFPDVARRLRGARLDARPAATGPFDRPVRRAFEPGALLAGDAAGYYDPFTGEGIYRALRCAEIAEPYALEHLETGSVTALAEYDRALRADLRVGRALERAVEMVVSRPRLFAAATAFLSAAPGPAAALLRRIGDAPSMPRGSA